MGFPTQDDRVEGNKRLRSAVAEQNVRRGLTSVSVTDRLIHRPRRLTAQKRNRIVEAKPPTPLTTVLQKIPLAALSRAFCVSSATCPDASKPIKMPAVARYDSAQFQPGEAPVPLYVLMNASSAVRNPMVFATPIGSQTRLRMKSMRTNAVENVKIHLK
jgi:hypothetical protein